MGQSASKRAAKPNALGAKSTSFREKTNKAATLLTGGRSRSSADVPSSLSTTSFDKSSTQSRTQQKPDGSRNDSQTSQSTRGTQSRTASSSSTVPSITTNGVPAQQSSHGFDAHQYNMSLNNENALSSLYAQPLSGLGSNTSMTVNNATNSAAAVSQANQSHGNSSHQTNSDRVFGGNVSMSNGKAHSTSSLSASNGYSAKAAEGEGVGPLRNAAGLALGGVGGSNLLPPLPSSSSRSADVNVRQRRNTAPDVLSRSSSLAHISDRAPSFTGSTVGSESSIFYTDFHEDVTAFEAAKTLRRTMKKYSKKLQYKTIEGKSSAGPGSIKSRLNALRPHVQSNSCSTIFVDQTVSQPDLDQILRCAATAIHMTFLWILSEPELPPYDPIFDEKLHPLTSHKVPPTYRTKCPRVTEIYDFLRAFFKAAVLKADVAIVTMVYISRLHNAGLVLQPGNWKRVVLGAVMMASKVWDDQAVWNADYCTVLPDVTVDSMNQLERAVLELLFYNVSVSSAEYAQHYFELRLYAHKADVEDGIRLSPLDVRRAKQLDALNVVHQSDSEVALKRISSSDNFEMPLRHVIIS